MKTTLIPTYAAVASLTVLLASLIITQDALLSCAMLAATVATLIALHDYLPRRYFFITPKPNNVSVANDPASRFPKPLGTLRLKSVKRRISVSA